MRASSVERLNRELDGEQLVLDVGGWIQPFTRADWVIDLMPYETRGMLGSDGPPPERFTTETWVQRDVCARDPWPFADGQFDFAVCSHTLEDVRDPVWVCGELARVARAGYVEVPSRLEEQSFGVEGEWAGWAHHAWLVEIADGGIEVVAKPHNIHTDPGYQFPPGFHERLTPEERVQTLFWEGELPCRERVFVDPAERDRWVASFVEARRRRKPRRRGVLR
jgi:Methyltransferase domain